MAKPKDTSKWKQPTKDDNKNAIVPISHLPVRDTYIDESPPSFNRKNIPTPDDLVSEYVEVR